VDYQYRFATLALCAALFVAGCNGGTASAPSGTSAEVVDTRPPEDVTADFLEGVRTGDDKKTASLLTPTARAKTADQELVVAPPGSETASFAIRECSLVQDGARVACDWTDVGADGRMHTDRIVWLLRKEPVGWRIAGMATKVFDDRPPVVLNFEDPEDMAKQQQWVSEEMARREKPAAAPAQPTGPAAANKPATTEVR
jgi:hypothetical protein